jgi:hypothetical protein
MLSTKFKVNDNPRRGRIYHKSRIIFLDLRDGYVEGIDIKNKSLYSITPKGRKLLKGWIAFISAYS